jgi:hypothetical protein
MAFAKKIEQKYVVKVIQNNKRRLERNVFMFDRRKQRKISDTAIHLIKRYGTVAVRSGTVRYERSRSRAKNETFTVIIYIHVKILSYIKLIFLIIIPKYYTFLSFKSHFQ